MINKLLGAAAMAAIVYGTVPASAANVVGCSGANQTKAESTVEAMADGPAKFGARREIAAAQDAMIKGNMRGCAMHLAQGDELRLVGPSAVRDAISEPSPVPRPLSEPSPIPRPLSEPSPDPLSIPVPAVVPTDPGREVSPAKGPIASRSALPGRKDKNQGACASWLAKYATVFA